MRISKAKFTKWASDAGRESWCLLRETEIPDDKEIIQVWLTPGGQFFQVRYINDELILITQGGGV